MLEITIKDGQIYSFIRDKWLVCTPEEEVRQGFICTLVNKFGYHIDQIDEEIQVNNSQRGQGQARADIVVWKSIFILCQVLTFMSSNYFYFIF